MSLREASVGRAYERLARRWALPLLVRSGLTPNQLTVAGMIVALLVVPAMAGHPWLGLVVMGFSGLFDGLDGLLARELKQGSALGAFLDSSLDRISDLAYLAGFWVLFWQAGLSEMWAGLAFLSALAFTLMISYVKARAESLGASCNIGFMERGLRVALLMLWALILGFWPRAAVLLWWGLAVYWVLTLATVLQRILWVRKQMGKDLAP